MHTDEKPKTPDFSRGDIGRAFVYPLSAHRTTARLLSQRFRATPYSRARGPPVQSKYSKSLAERRPVRSAGARRSSGRLQSAPPAGPADRVVRTDARNFNCPLHPTPAPLALCNIARGYKRAHNRFRDLDERWKSASTGRAKSPAPPSSPND